MFEAPPPLELDGSVGEGGGQIARTALFLSVLLQRPFRLSNIRLGRRGPGLKDQHVGIIKILETITASRAKGARVGSLELEFRPGLPQGGDYRYDIGTAGALSLFLQTLLPVVMLTPGRTRLTLTGGTDVPWSPTMDWLRNVLWPWVRPWADGAQIQVRRRGFYPRGGGEVEIEWTNGFSHPLDVGQVRQRATERLGGHQTNPGRWRVQGSAIETRHLAAASVAHRMQEAAHAALLAAGHESEIAAQTVEAYSPGCSLTLWADDGRGNRLGADALGTRGLPAEKVGEQAAQRWLEDAKTGATVDRHMADHVVPWVALGAGAVMLPVATPHLETNIDTCRRFLGADAVRLDGMVLCGPRTPRVTL